MCRMAEYADNNSISSHTEREIIITMKDCLGNERRHEGRAKSRVRHKWLELLKFLTHSHSLGFIELKLETSAGE